MSELFLPQNFKLPQFRKLLVKLRTPVTAQRASARKYRYTLGSAVPYSPIPLVSLKPGTHDPPVNPHLNTALATSTQASGYGVVSISIVSTITATTQHRRGVLVGSALLDSSNMVHFSRALMLAPALYSWQRKAAILSSVVVFMMPTAACGALPQSGKSGKDDDNFFKKLLGNLPANVREDVEGFVETGASTLKTTIESGLPSKVWH
jgi:hypothetical protein